MAIAPIQKSKPLREQVLENIRSALLHGRFEPGDRITEEGVAEMLGVSRTPVREALGALVSQGILETRPSGGYYVPVLDEKDLDDFVDVRLLLEPFAARWAAEHAKPHELESLRAALAVQEELLETGDPTGFFLGTQTFWDALWTLSGNNGLRRCLTTLAEHYHYQFVSVLALRDLQVRRRGVELLRALVNAIVAGDGEEAARRVT